MEKHNLRKFLEKIIRGWKDGSVGKSTDCSSKGHEFKSQHPHGGSQPSVKGSNTLFWCLKIATVYSHIINKYIFKKIAKLKKRLA